MTIVSQAITLAPVSGGTTTALNSQYTNAVKLTNNRFVVCYFQTGPARRLFTIVDNLNGLNDTGAPTISQAVYNDTNVAASTSYTVKMVRLNDTTFLYAWSVGSTWTVQVFIVTGTSIVLKSTSTWTIGGQDTWGNTLNHSIAQCPIAFIPLGDNTILYATTASTVPNGSSYPFTYVQNLNTTQMYWNPTAFTWTSIYTGSQSEWGYAPWTYANSDLLHNEPNASWYSLDQSYMVLPDGRVSQNFKGISAISYPPAAGAVQTGFSNYVNMASTIWSPPGTTGGAWTATYTTTFPPYYEPCYLSTTRAVLADWHSAYYYPVAYTAVNQGGSTFPVTTVGAMNLTTPVVLPLSADYHAVIDRRHFINPNNGFQMKIVRREDSNMIYPSAGSTNTYGFTVNVPKINMFWDKNRPFTFSNGDIAWFGINSTGQFAYNVIKQPSLPTS